jgi:hypothetical protein
MPFFKTKEEVRSTEIDDLGGSEDIKDGSLYFIGEEGENSNKLTIQEASGAPVEQHSPLGYSVGWVTIVFLNISMMVGTGVFSTP